MQPRSLLLSSRALSTSRRGRLCRAQQPPALKESGAWPLSSLRQGFLNGSLTRLVDPDTILKAKIVEFVSRATAASGRRSDGGYERVWFEELVAPDEVTFDARCSC